MTGGAPEVRVAYIAGSSHSGSTLLGLILGGIPGIIYCGEINQYLQTRFRSGSVACTCGAEYSGCPLWGRVYAELPHGRDLNPSPGFSRANLRILLTTLLPGRRSADDRTTEYGAVVGAIRRHAVPDTEEPPVIVDSSKSLVALDALRCSANVDLRVIHLVRSARGVAASFRKRGLNPLAATAAWILLNAALPLYFRRHGLPFLRLDYHSFCDNGEAKLAEIRRFLGHEGVAVADLPHLHGTHHIMGGNRKIRQLATGDRDFEGLVYHGDSTALSRPVRLLAKLLADPLYRFLVPAREPAPKKTAFR